MHPDPVPVLPPLDLDALAEGVAVRLARLLGAERDRLLDRRELAAWLGVSERAVGTMVQNHHLPPPILQTGGVTRWSLPEVQKYLAGRRSSRPRKGRGRYRRTEGSAE